MLSNDHLRLSKLFAVVDRPLDLNQLLQIKLHLLNNRKIGEMNERALNDIECRHFAKLAEWDSYIADIEKTTLDTYISKMTQVETKKGKKNDIN